MNVPLETGRKGPQRQLRYPGEQRRNGDTPTHTHTEKTNQTSRREGEGGRGKREEGRGKDEEGKGKRERERRCI